MRAASTEPLVVDRVSKRFGDVTAVDELSLTVHPGELLSLVGPSGCGKSTVLRLVAGLNACDGGAITIDGREVDGPRTWVPTERRRVGIVFQDHALFPHLTVADNVAFGLGRGGPDRERRVGEVLELVELTRYARRYPHELSGGEQQRVALARALAPRPTVVLLDEPFSNLDRNLRVAVREQTIAVLRAADATVLFVTHDQEEALAVGDRVAVMRAGRLEHVAQPAEVFHAPRNRFVATFMGEADFLPGRLGDGRLETELGTLRVADRESSGDVEVMLRPHEVTLHRARDATARIVRVEFRGAFSTFVVELPSGRTVRALTSHTAHLTVGEPVEVRFEPGHDPAWFPLAGGAHATSRAPA